ncbi:MAG: hypothetical protein KDA75_19120 [Planctomycetaceae bacterium]|nr:hypothetical protein [Planctomycetaceae bacterium]
MPRRRHCGDAPRFGESSGDDDVEASEIRFTQWLAVAEAEDLLTESDADDWRNDGAAGELLRRWWRRPVRASELAESPHRTLAGPELRGHSDSSPESARDDVLALPGSGDGVRSVEPLQRQTTLEIVARHLGLRPKSVRLFDPLSESSLAALPAGVAADIGSILKRCDRQVVDHVRPILQALRIVCEPLEKCSVQVVSPSNYRQRTLHHGVEGELDQRTAPTGDRANPRRCSDINLRYRGRVYCLLRFAAPYHVADVSDRSGRAVGCSATILAEDEESLRREIARFQDRLQARLPLCQSEEQRQQARLEAIDPSARRFTRRNPFAAAPEDRLSLEECFCRHRDDESDVEPIDVEDLPSWERYTERHGRPVASDRTDRERIDDVSEPRHVQCQPSPSRSKVRPARRRRRHVATGADNPPIIIRPAVSSRTNSQDSVGNRSESP